MSAERDVSRGRGDPRREKPVELCRDDRRKLYALLDAGVPATLRGLERKLNRQDKLLAVLVPANAALLWKVFGGPAPPAAPVEAIAVAVLRFFGLA